MIDVLKFLKKNLPSSNPFQKKITLSDNKKMTDSEYELVSRFCDIFKAIEDSVEKNQSRAPSGGIFWSSYNRVSGPFELHLRKDRSEIDHSFLFNTRFRDFPTIAYDSDLHTPTPDFWVRRYHRLMKAVPENWRVQIPAQFGEIGWECDGYPVNRLTSINQERVNVMHVAGITHYLEKQTTPRIMEIGAGGGEMGYVFCKALPNATWYDCDLLGSLVYSAIHLAVLLPFKKHYIYVGDLKLSEHIDESLIIRCPKKASQLQNAVVNIPHFLLDDFKGFLELDFTYNTYSFGEMPPNIVEKYSLLLSDFLKNKGVLLEQNGALFEAGGSTPEKILSAQFSQHPWPSLYDGRSILSGPIRIWTNNDVGRVLKENESNLDILELVKGFDDQGDAPDIEYSLDAWGKLGYLFPNGA